MGMRELSVVPHVLYLGGDFSYTDVCILANESLISVHKLYVNLPQDKISINKY